MADIELVINISEEKYDVIKSDSYNTFPAEMKEWGLEAIRNGVPLPKGCDVQRIIPKRVNVQKWIYTDCPNPNCNHKLSVHYGDGYYTIEHQPDFCPACGQALLWESEKDEE